VGVRPGVGAAGACLVADARVADGGWLAPATVAGSVVRLGRGVGDGEEETGAGDGGATEGAAARETWALATASLWPPSTTASVIATPATVSTPPATAAAERKRTSSMRA
jgi:hypothetical protein